MNGFWQDGFWSPIFWSAGFWQEDDQPAVSPPPTFAPGWVSRAGAGRAIRRDRRVRDAELLILLGGGK